MYKIACVNLGPARPHSSTMLELAGQSFVIDRWRPGSEGTLWEATTLLRELDDQYDAIALEGVVPIFRSATQSVTHPEVERFLTAAQRMPIFDGSRLKRVWERWALKQVAEEHSGIFNYRRILLMCATERFEWASLLSEYTDRLRFADPITLAGRDYAIDSFERLERFAHYFLPRLMQEPYASLYPLGHDRLARSERGLHAMERADVICGDFNYIRKYAPEDLAGKVIVTDTVSAEDVADLKRRGVVTLATTTPIPAEGEGLPISVFEAVLSLTMGATSASLRPDDFLNVIATADLKPHVKQLQPETSVKGKFAFVIHPLALDYIKRARGLEWTRVMPDAVLERSMAHLPPMYLSRITGAKSPTTGREVEGILLGLGSTPKEMLRRKPSFTYRRLVTASHMAERMGARIMGLGAFTSVVGDAGITVAHHAEIGITSGNSLTVAATLETAKQVMQKMGMPLDQGKAVVIGATGSIGSVCARLLAQAIYDVVLVAPRPERLIELKRQIERETPEAHVTIATSPDNYVGQADLIITTTSAASKRVVDVMKLKPGAVVCDIARPPDIPEAEAAKRDDILVIESGEIIIPGDIDFGYDIGLPAGTSYACLAETCLLAMEGLYDDFTLGRNIELDKVKFIYKLFKKHGFKLAGLRSFGRYVSDEEIEALAERTRKKIAASTPQPVKSQPSAVDGQPSTVEG